MVVPLARLEFLGGRPDDGGFVAKLDLTGGYGNEAARDDAARDTFSSLS